MRVATLKWVLFMVVKLVAVRRLMVVGLMVFDTKPKWYPPPPPPPPCFALLQFVLMNNFVNETLIATPSKLAAVGEGVSGPDQVGKFVLTHTLRRLWC